MDQKLILLVTLVMVYVAAGVHGSSHLMFANNTEVNITRGGCGETKLCVETPDNCDPVGNSSCLFTSINAGTAAGSNSTDLAIELRGKSGGFIVLELIPNTTEGNTMIFVCGKNNTNGSSTFFRTGSRPVNTSNDDSGSIMDEEIMVKEIRVVSGADNVTRCEFIVPAVNGSRAGVQRAGDGTVIIFTVALATGSETTGALTFTIQKRDGPLNVADPSSNVNTTGTPPPSTAATAAATTAAATAAATAATTASSAVSATAPGTLALMSVLTFCIIQRTGKGPW
ncbi:putative ferric-chelate reductase 1 [Lampris incognitus]|uniref:putative ferric-chelate reductase 1 n=1 Tax=Lampris incognitus TaxID=2546036 RepID=UPI0024B5F2CA|nr:putative ferric-chelate reductase 1 [Lampris incognitus]